MLVEYACQFFGAIVNQQAYVIGILQKSIPKNKCRRFAAMDIFTGWELAELRTLARTTGPNPAVEDRASA